MTSGTYIKLLLIHLGLGLLVYLFEPFSKIYFFMVLAFFGFMVLYKNNKNEEALYAAVYIAGIEVFSRMTDAALTYEFAKYAVMMFLFLGMFYRGINLRSWPYFLYLLLLVPGILFSAINLNYGTNIGNAIGFNLSGPVTLGVAALYCYQKKISAKRLNELMLMLLLPILTTAFYLYLYTPDIRDVITGTESNFATSGGYGPNQVSTILGLGSFILFARLLLIRDRTINLIDLGLLAMVMYRAVVTFSRGGVLVAAICSALLLLVFIYRAPISLKLRLIPRIGVMVAVIASTWLITTVNTSGLIINRYANQDAAGREDNDLTSGRLLILTEELNAFYENPITGLGIGKAKEYRLEQIGHEVASHNEVFRLLSEHGVFGILAFLILLLTPLLDRLKDRSNILMLPLLAYWFLTINHSSMRIAMPAVVYGLCLLQIQQNGKTDIVHR